MKKSANLSLYLIFSFFLLLFMGACIYMQSSLTLGAGAGKGYLWAYIYLFAAIIGCLVYLLLSKGIKSPSEEVSPTSNALLLLYGIAMLITTMLLSVYTFRNFQSITRGSLETNTVLLNTITGIMLIIIGLASALVLIASSRSERSPRTAMLVSSGLMLIFLVDQTAKILPQPDIVVYGPMVISICLSALFFLELSKYQAGNVKPYRKALIFGWLGAISSLSSVFLWASYTGKFLGRLDLSTLFILLSNGLFLLLTSIRMTNIAIKKD